MPDNQPPLLHPYVQMILSGTAMLPPQDELAAYCLELHSLIAELARPVSLVTRSVEVQRVIDAIESVPPHFTVSITHGAVNILLGYITQLEASQPKPQSDKGLPGGYYFEQEPEEFMSLNGEPVFTLRDRYGKRAEYIPQRTVAALSRQAPVPTSAAVEAAKKIVSIRGMPRSQVEQEDKQRLRDAAAIIQRAMDGAKPKQEQPARGIELDDIQAAWNFVRNSDHLLDSTEGHLAVLRGIRHGRALSTQPPAADGKLGNK